MTRTYDLQLYSPHSVQKLFHASKARYRVASWGRQSGKSTGCINDIFHRAWIKNNQNIWFISPTFDQAKVQYRRALKMFPEHSGIYRHKPNHGEFWLPLINGSNIRFKSGWNFDGLRGDTINGVVIDEVRDQHPDLWRLVIRPMLGTTQGWAAFVSTPRGFDQFYEVALRAQANEDGMWDFMKAPSTCNPLFTQDEYLQAQRDMSESEFAQEILAEFRNITQGTAYYAFSDANLCTQNRLAPLGKEIAPYLPIHLYCDFNVLPMAWTIAQYQNGHGHHFLSEIFLKTRSNTEEAINEFIHRYKTKWAHDHRPETKVIVCGDATGKASKTSSTSGTDYTIIFDALKRAGITYEDRTPSVNPLVKDRVNTVNARFKNARGEIEITINPVDCPNLTQDCYRVVWKDGASAILDQVSDKMRTHASDSMGYGVCEFNGMQSQGSAGELRIVRV